MFYLQMAGSFHFAPGKSFSIRQFHIHDFQFTNVKLSHTINHLSFGEKIEFAKTHPLDGLRVDVEGEYKVQTIVWLNNSSIAITYSIILTAYAF